MSGQDLGQPSGTFSKKGSDESVEVKFSKAGIQKLSETMAKSMENFKESFKFKMQHSDEDQEDGGGEGENEREGGERKEGDSRSQSPSRGGMGQLKMISKLTKLEAAREEDSAYLKGLQHPFLYASKGNKASPCTLPPPNVQAVDGAHKSLDQRLCQLEVVLGNFITAPHRGYGAPKPAPARADSSGNTREGERGGEGQEGDETNANEAQDVQRNTEKQSNSAQPADILNKVEKWRRSSSSDSGWGTLEVRVLSNDVDGVREGIEGVNEKVTGTQAQVVQMREEINELRRMMASFQDQSQRQATRFEKTTARFESELTALREHMQKIGLFDQNVADMLAKADERRLLLQQRVERLEEILRNANLGFDPELLDDWRQRMEDEQRRKLSDWSKQFEKLSQSLMAFKEVTVSQLLKVLADARYTRHHPAIGGVTVGGGGVSGRATPQRGGALVRLGSRQGSGSFSKSPAARAVTVADLAANVLKETERAEKEEEDAEKPKEIANAFADKAVVKPAKSPDPAARSLTTAPPHPSLAKSSPPDKAVEISSGATKTEPPQDATVFDKQTNARTSIWNNLDYHMEDKTEAGVLRKKERYFHAWRLFIEIRRMQKEAAKVLTKRLRRVTGRLSVRLWKKQIRLLQRYQHQAKIQKLMDGLAKVSAVVEKLAATGGDWLKDQLKKIHEALEELDRKKMDALDSLEKEQKKENDQMQEQIDALVAAVKQLQEMSSNPDEIANLKKALEDLNRDVFTCLEEIDKKLKMCATKAELNLKADKETTDALEESVKKILGLIADFWKKHNADLQRLRDAVAALFALLNGKGLNYIPALAQGYDPNFKCLSCNEHPENFWEHMCFGNDGQLFKCSNEAGFALNSRPSPMYQLDIHLASLGEEPASHQLMINLQSPRDLAGMGGGTENPGRSASPPRPTSARSRPSSAARRDRNVNWTNQGSGSGEHLGSSVPSLPPRPSSALGSSRKDESRGSRHGHREAPPSLSLSGRAAGNPRQGLTRAHTAYPEKDRRPFVGGESGRRFDQGYGNRRSKTAANFQQEPESLELARGDGGGGTGAARRAASRTDF
uniref:Uncharacterized protein n=1 Tax=Chromera velia CCMP2878 TaxID=1169474 RepID=A0A0G4G5L1_9ALVE|eukprot:Cvel_20228.t1-p1 / transcript=Cvel_20228.t1 / gene=Cvel_20228 / organism=Chromera_velia_CCMP2878 / gene_product=hypothetical protein / transcript_product=hypothetical protein / location=Cvel_scaffold1802:774-9344(-) / protein_length=1070 / sequence_SO=supercontig / SO=protein_coding / is_pseudo=false